MLRTSKTGIVKGKGTLVTVTFNKSWKTEVLKGFYRFFILSRNSPCFDHFVVLFIP